MTFSDALEDIRVAFKQLEFAIKLLSYCELGKLLPSDFDTDHLVELEEGNLHFPPGYFSEPDNIYRAALIGVPLALGATAIVLDQALNLEKSQSQQGEIDEVSELRTLVFMVRCAYAHGIAEPRWEVRKKHRRIISQNINGRTISVDLSEMHCQPFEVSAIGGYEVWYLIRDAVVSRLENAMVVQ